jgi:hypothetical protein
MVGKLAVAKMVPDLPANSGTIFPCCYNLFGILLLLGNYLERFFLAENFNLSIQLACGRY